VADRTKSSCRAVLQQRCTIAFCVAPCCTAQQVRTVYNDSFLSLQGALRRRSAWPDLAWLGLAWLGSARLGSAWLGFAGRSRPADTAATAVCAAEKVSLPIQRQPLKL
jgi:hypothetical protein